MACAPRMAARQWHFFRLEGGSRTARQRWFRGRRTAVRGAIRIHVARSRIKTNAPLPQHSPSYRRMAPASCTLEENMAKAWDVCRRELLGGVTAENKRCVCTTESERIRQCGINITFACLMGN